MKKTPFRILCSILPALALSLPLGANEGDSEQEVTVKPNELIIVGSGQAEFYQNEQMGVLMVAGTAVPDELFSSLADAAASYSASLPDLASDQAKLTIYFASNEVLANLSEADVAALQQLAAAGAIVGVNSTDGSRLKELLGVPESRLLIDGIGQGTSAIYLIYGTNELLLPVEGLSPREILASVFEWAEEIDKEAMNRGASPWEAIGNREFKRFDKNEIRLLAELYKLPSRSDADFYRFDFSLASVVKDYKCDDWSSRCGWYTTDSDMKATLHFGAELYDYMPQGTLSERTQSFEIGGSLTTSDLGISAGYSESYSTPDMSITDRSSFVSEEANWDVSFNGPKYEWYPFITKPANVARSSYKWDPSMIVKVSPGKKGVICINPTIRFRYDTIEYYFFVSKIKGQTSTWSWTECYAFGANGWTYQGSSPSNPN